MPRTISTKESVGLTGQGNRDWVNPTSQMSHTQGTVGECRQMLLCQASFHPRQVTLLFIQKHDASTVVRAHRITYTFFAALIFLRNLVIPQLFFQAHSL